VSNFYRATPRKTREYIVDCLESGLVPMVTSSPGMGKSSLMASVCREFNLEMRDHRVSTSAPEDFSGLPRFRDDGRAEFAPFGDLFPLEGDPLPEGKDGWMLFLDEYNSGTKMVQAATYKLILDKMTGQKKLHERCVITAAGNLMTDRAIVQSLSTAMQSRVVHIEMELSFEELLYDVMLPKKWDERVVAFLNYDNNKLMDFRPDHDEKTFCCPRTWEFMHKHLTRGGQPKQFGYEQRNGADYFTMQDKLGLYAGTITSGVAAEFVAFCAIYKELINIRAVLADPANAPVPTENQRKWATVSHLMGKITEDNFGDICIYINRFDLAFKVLFFRAAMVQHPKLRTHPDFAKAMVTLSRYLAG